MTSPLPLSPFAEFSALLLICALAGGLLVQLRQPVMITYLIAGIALGPAGFGLVHAHDQVEILAQIGVTVLLFVVGLKLDLTHVRHIGPVALATGLGQLMFTILGGFGLTLLLGKPWLEALYIAVALTFSSTIIVVKLLSDKRELDSLHGRIAVGFLIVQDLAVVLAMMVMSAMREAGQRGGLEIAGSLGLRIAAGVVLTAVTMRWILPKVVPKMARSQELLLLFGVAWALSLAALGEWAGFSKEAGAFLAGFTLATTSFRDALSARLTPLRDFLLLFFFIELGSKLELSTLNAELPSALTLSLFVLVGNPLIVMAIMGYMGYRRRTGFMAGLTVAQISEFSIIFIAMGITMGHVSVSSLSVTTLVGMVTIVTSTYMILYAQPLFERFSGVLSIFERDDPFRECAVDQGHQAEDAAQVILLGLGRYGRRVYDQLADAGVGVMGVDFDPEVVRELTATHAVRFGDGEDLSFLEELPLAQASWVVSTMPQLEANLAMIQGLRQAGYSGSTALVARTAYDAQRLKQAGADHLFLVFEDAADHGAQWLVQALRQDHAPPSA